MNKRKTITNTIMMIRPASFGYNAETAENNSFQSKEGAEEKEQIANKAMQEFDAMVIQLRSKGIEVIVMNDSPSPEKPDAVFPNNWFSTHASGEIISFPMQAETRRVERSEDYISELIDRFKYNHRIAFESYENRNIFLEGTGSLILDRIHRIAYACLSPRTDLELLDEFCLKMGYTKVAFRSLDQQGQEIYHTNVMMSIGRDFAVICLDSIVDVTERAKVVHHLEESGKAIIEISQDQVAQFAGNMLQVMGMSRKPYLVMSEAAAASLNEGQKQHIHNFTETIVVPIPTIEKYGGGSVRCMMAEIFFPMS